VIGAVSVAARARLVSGLIAVGALIALVAIGPVGSARADSEGIDQITGNGNTDSAVTVSWSQGIVGADNKTVVAPRDPNSPLGFMHDDFKNLKVTVGQTTSLVHQAVKVTWSGGKPTAGEFQGDFLQIMQCYGDAASGPDPEACQYGSLGLLPSGQNAFIGSRGGAVCASDSKPDPSNPPGTLDGSPGSLGCDALEPTSGSHIDPHGTIFNYSVPFVPVGTTDKVYGAVTSYYDQYDTNEVQEARTGLDGTGQQFFQTLTAKEAPGLGCGQLESSSKARDCWLVIVPRGEYKANGYKIDTGGSSTLNFLNDSPLGASNWDQRIQVHLGFAPLQPNCPIGSAKERQTIGTELVSRAAFSWQLALNAAAKCKTLYGYSATPEATNTALLSTPGSQTGLAFTTIPIGSEATRLNGGDSSLATPGLIYAPITASALTFGFNINLSTGYIATPVKLTPRLVAKALTQSYKFELTDFTPSNPGRGPGPDWAKNNPNSILTDPEFRKLNPRVPNSTASSLPIAPLLTEDHSGANQQIWAWVQADQAAREWLSGKPDENGMVINPHYKALHLERPPATDSYPRADPTCFNTGEPGERDPGRCALDLIPYVNNFDDGATRVRSGNNPEGAGWDPNKVAPDGTPGWWGNGGVESAGRTFMWAVTDSSSLANYGLVPADLCDASGSHCTSANTASVSTAMSAAKPDRAGLLHVDPANPGSGGYPLVDVTYAAVRIDQDAAALDDYATLIDYAAGTGQTAGVNPGQLPHGYLPLPNALRSQAKATAGALRAFGHPAGAGTTPPSFAQGAQQTLPAIQNPVAPVGGSASGGTAAGPGTSTATTSTTAPAVTPSPQPSEQAPAEFVAKRTPGTSPGAIRWALLAVVIAGLAGASTRPLARLFVVLREIRR
jgi:hypothetical protein